MSSSNISSIPAPTLESGNDPCSFNYLRYYSRVPAMPPAPAGDSKSNSKTKRRPWVIFKQMSKKNMSDDKPKSGFVMPYEMKEQNPLPPYLTQSPIRSRLRLKAEETETPDPTPESGSPVTYTTVYADDWRGSYRVHSYDGGDRPSLSAKSSVRFSHPAVGSVRCRTPSAPKIHNDDACSVKSSEASDTDVPLDSSDRPLIRPKDVWRNSEQFKTEDGQLTPFDDFKSRFDSHKLRSDPPSARRSQTRPPTLGFLPKTAPIALDEPIKDPPKANAVDVEINRNQALQMLETGGVLAVLPEGDMPASAVPVLSRQYPQPLSPSQHPDILTPGSRISVDASMPRPFSYPASSPLYKAYNPSSPLVSNKHGGFLARTNAVKSANRRSREIGRPDDFDKPKMPIRRPPIPSPPSSSPESIRRKPFAGNRTFLASPTPPASPKLPSARPGVNPVQQEQKKVMHESKSTPNLNRKPLPPFPPQVLRPALKNASKESVPKPHLMNENGYPVINRVEAARYSTTALYQNRSVNDVEAKYLREQAKKSKSSTVTDKKATKVEEKEAKKQKKIVKKQKQKAELIAQRPDLVEQQKQIEKGVKKLLNV